MEPGTASWPNQGVTPLVARADELLLPSGVKIAPVILSSVLLMLSFSKLQFLLQLPCSYLKGAGINSNVWVWGVQCSIPPNNVLQFNSILTLPTLEIASDPTDGISPVGAQSCKTDCASDQPAIYPMTQLLGSD